MLNVVTDASLLKSLIKLPDLIAFLVENKQPYCGICDDEPFAFLELYQKCLEKKIKPILGLNLLCEGKPLKVYPKDFLGYKALLKLNTKKYTEILAEDLNNPHLKIVIPYESLDLYSSFLKKENVYLGYASLEEKKNALLLSKNIVYLKEIRALFKEDTYYLKYLAELKEPFAYDDESYYNLHLAPEDKDTLTQFISDIDLKLEFNERHIPKYNQDVDSFAFLKRLSYKGLEKRLGNVSKEYQARLSEELQVIKDMGFVDYFLIVYDYVLFAKKKGIIVGPGRGSAAGSLVSYAIGIIDIDPIKYDLLFARFLNPARKKMPDIDIDFEDQRRGEVIEYVKSRYGKENVALGLTFTNYKARLILRDLAKVLKVDSSVFEKFIKIINPTLSLKKNLENPSVKKYLEMYSFLKELYQIAFKFEGLKKNVSTHAAGVVISAVPLDDVMPIYKENDTLKTGYVMDFLENLGLLKMDFLGLRNLTLIKKISENIPGFELNRIPLEDPKVYELFGRAETHDIFQFESRYARQCLLKLKPENFNELAIAVALVRPGPSNQIDQYVLNKTSRKYALHPDLVPILSSTYGVMIYQEQVMKILEVIAGYSEYEADTVRIAISKKKEEVLKKERERFIQSSLQRGYTKDFVTDLFAKIEKFSEYGFNKAHSVSYALIVYELAYLKVNYPVEYATVLLSETKDNEKSKRYITELKEKGVKLLKPNINVSDKEYKYKNKYLLMPLSVIKNLPEKVIEDILSVRTGPFADIFDFFLRCKDILNNKLFSLLAKSGALECFKYNTKTLIENYDILYNYAELGDPSAPKPILTEYEEYGADDLRKLEIECYGMYIGNHPCSIYQNVVKVSKAKDYLFKNVNMTLLVEKITKIKTKKGEDMAFILGSDETGSCELTLFPNVFAPLTDLKVNDIILVNGKSSKRFDKYQIIVNSLTRK